MSLSVPLRFVAEETPVRRGEPVTVGLPWPKGAVRDDSHFRLIGPDGTPRTLQAEVLDRWPDGSIRWCLFDFLATVDGRNDEYRVEVGDGPRAMPVFNGNEPTAFDGGLRFGDVELGVIVRFPNPPAPDLHDPPFDGLTRLTDGPVRRRWRLAGAISEAGLRLALDADLFAGLPVARVRLTVTNTRPADHPGGNWDLGNGGSVTISALSVELRRKLEPFAVALTSAERGLPATRTPLTSDSSQLTLWQPSSGGEQWDSSNHMTRDRTVPHKTRGYTTSLNDAPLASGMRATPVLTVTDPTGLLGIAMPAFWQNFPKAISATLDEISLELFPDAEGLQHELQGGEQKTHEFTIAFGRDTVTDEPLVWARSPLRCHADPEWYAASGAVPYLTPKAGDPHATYLRLADQAIDGPDTFFTKRETIDEYGWRHYGDIYGDHEAVNHKGPTPLVSHYNNQYDCVGAFGVQFLRSADMRWWEQMIACADHTCDIDIYHTDGDKPAYNRGLFWHTYHYADADTGTHRSYPKSLRRGPQESLTEKMDQLGATADRLKKAYQVGGGPSGSHNYNAGLMLAYFLTGNPIYKDTAVDLARFVIRMEDPGGTPFRFLSRQYTGHATESGAGYHGPGRASGNSVLALLVGHRLTGERAFLDKAEQLIRRVAAPNQDLERLDLLNAELRWFYTMFLQAVGAYLDYKIDLGELDERYAYGRETLLHYARWMAVHERPILDTPERLQYPNETWAAQDMRKVEVFQFAAKHAVGEEKARFLERAEWFFRYVERTLDGFPTKSLCRPVVLMMKYGWSRNFWRLHPDTAAPPPAVPLDVSRLPEWRMFVPQRQLAVKRAKMLLVAGAVGGLLGLVGLGWLLLG